MKKLFTITRSSNLHFLKFWLFNFSNFQTTFVKMFTEISPGFKIDFESADKILRIHQYLWSEISRKWNNGLLKQMKQEPFASQILPNEGNRKASILLILLKCIVVGYSNGNENFTDRLFSIYGPLNTLFHFFDISFIVFFTRLLPKGLWRNYPFSAQISKIHFKL